MLEPQKIIERMKKYDPNVDEELIRKAYNRAFTAHMGQKRISGEPYIIHPVEVAMLLTCIEADTSTICAALLHDVIEDTDMNMSGLEEEFGAEIAAMVDGVTKLSKINFKSREEAQAENLRKMFMAMAKDIRVILIKLADRLHNMRTLKYQPEERQQDIARETMDIYAPLAHRLGVFKFKWELEDLSLYYLDRQSYNEIAEALKHKRSEREAYVHTLIQQIREGLDQIGVKKADIAGRPKNIYSIQKKMIKQGTGIDEIYDKIAIRVIVDDIRDCYGVLGIIHTIWRPLPGRFKDYIATPKSNFYQSLHTTLIGQGGEPFEVQIRTWDMHRTAEYGIAAHWRYKEGMASKGKKFDEKLAWLRQILEWQQDVKDTREFMESLKVDLFEDTVFVFTPKGDVMELPKGSCPVDFAYRVHTEIGHKCVGARVNGRIVPLDFPLSNGDIVEIMTSKHSPGPTQDWLNFVRTNSAKSRIKSFFKKEHRGTYIIRGRELLENGLRKEHLDPKELSRDRRVTEFILQLGYNNMNDLLAALGEGLISVEHVINRFKDTFFPNKPVEDVLAHVGKHPARYRDGSHALKVKGVDDVAVRLGRCCNPLPGDEILGYITRGRGVSVHHRECPNMQSYVRTEPERVIEVEWVEEKGSYSVEIEIKAMDRAGLTGDVVMVLYEAKVPVNSVFSRATRQDRAQINLKVDIKDLNQLSAVLQRLFKVKDVYDVRRVQPGEPRRGDESAGGGAEDHFKPGSRKR